MAIPPPGPTRTGTPLIPNPPYPEHPSGLTCFGGALAATFSAVFETDAIAFSVRSAASGTERSYTSFTQMLREGIEARIWSGIHFRSAVEQAARIGRRVARGNIRRALRPLDDDRR